MILDVPRCLDLTRLSRRAGRILTGVDRVELAYLKRLLSAPCDLFGLVQTKAGFLVLDRTGLKVFDQLIETGTWGQADLLSRLILNDPLRRKVESSLRRMAIARCRPAKLRTTLSSVLPKSVHYINVGHSNLTHKVLSAFAGIPGSKIAVMIHDTIPLDYPQYQRPETPEKFRKQLKAVSGLADYILSNSQQTTNDLKIHLRKFGHVPHIITAHLGVGLQSLQTVETSTEAAPYFVAVGTIEPRKNHALLLDIWKQLAADGPVPTLHICGARGWRNDDVFNELDRMPIGIKEHNKLNDADLAALVKGATAILMPSFAEGYGLPMIEAAALGTAIVATDLPVYREFLQDIPVYLSPTDKYQWINAIKTLIVDETECPATLHTPPTWDAHFNRVLRLV